MQFNVSINQSDIGQFSIRPDNRAPVLKIADNELH